MKKWISVMGAGMLTLGLAACGDTATPAGDGEGDKNSESDLTLEEVFAETTEASEQIKSLHADMSTNQLMAMGEDGMEMEMVMDSEMDMTMEPLAFYQTAETSIVSEDIQNENPTAMEMYYTEDGMYVYESSMDTWMKMPEDAIGDLESMMDQETADPSQQLEELAAFKDDFKFEQTDDEYILTLNAAGEEFKELMDQQLEKTLGQMEIEAQTGLEDMDIHSVEYEIYIDKETFLANNINVKMDMDLNIEGETMNIKSDIKSEYSKYDEIEAITVPEDVVEQAQEL